MDDLEEDSRLADSLHDGLLCDGLRKLYNMETLCDITLVTKVGQIHAHKVVLAASSLYFRTMFTSEIGCQKDSLEMYSVDHDSLLAIVSYFYTGNITLSKSNIFSLMEVEDLLQVGWLRTLCYRFLSKNLDPQNCWQMRSVSELYRYYEIADQCLNYIRLTFRTLIKEYSFLEVPYALLDECLNSAVLNVPSEDVLLCRLCEWVLHDVDERGVYLEKILSKVEPNRVSNWREVSQELLTMFSAYEGDDVVEIISEWIKSANKTRETIQSTEQNRYFESVLKVVLAVGGNSYNRVLGSVECLSSLQYPWKLTIPTSDQHSYIDANFRVLPLLNKPRWGAAVASSDFKVFILGGWSGFGPGHEEKSVECFDSIENKWRRLPPLPSVVSSCAAAHSDRLLYCSGGFSTQRVVSNQVWVLVDGGKCWRSVCPMQVARREHSLVALHGSLYAIGGLGQDGKTLRSVERYNPWADTWSFVRSMNMSRMRHGSVALGRYIYVIGGKTYTTLEDTQDTEIYNERYDTVTDEWSVVGLCEGGLRKGCGQRSVRSVVRGMDIITTGGGNGTVVEVYNTASGVATPGPSLNEARSGHALATVLAPIHSPSPI